ncbi:hypothetical protein CEXT_395251 [Caerostris extrusa]|uniref:Uncharacterized protein n=1 Tax=Caerostris extrusa TaxID=172846 RepID=A0AAV4XVS0_CAEEX|nr:hypothetical protein CEXT_395251 [Caerostris extrusa]
MSCMGNGSVRAAVDNYYAQNTMSCYVGKHKCTSSSRRNITCTEYNNLVVGKRQCTSSSRQLCIRIHSRMAVYERQSCDTMSLYGKTAVYEQKAVDNYYAQKHNVLYVTGSVRAAVDNYYAQNTMSCMWKLGSVRDNYYAQNTLSFCM